jgi:hypothetical protein
VFCADNVTDAESMAGAHDGPDVPEIVQVVEHNAKICA